MFFVIYQILFPLVLIAVAIKLMIGGRGSILRERPGQICQRLGWLSSRKLQELRASGEKVLWIHAASVGEVNAAAVIVKALKSASRRPRILMTTSTASGREHARSLKIPPDLAVLAPADFYPCVRLFLRRTRPYALLIMETELWPAMLRAAIKTGLPIAIANGRVTERAFNRYRWIRGIMAPALEKISYVAAQTEADAGRFAFMGVPKNAIRVVGNLKNDILPPDAAERAKAKALVSRLGWDGQLIWAAGSTWPEEERAVLSAFLQVKKDFPELKLILAPRHTERADDSKRLLAAHHVQFASLSSLSNGKDRAPITDCLLVDELGRLHGLYGVCDFAFVGGTLQNIGGHNVLEPAISAKPVLHGPHTKTVQEAAQALQSGGGFEVHDSNELAATVKKLLADKRLRGTSGRQALEAAHYLSGATARTLEFLSPFFISPPRHSRESGNPYRGISPNDGPPPARG